MSQTPLSKDQLEDSKLILLSSTFSKKYQGEAGTEWHWVKRSGVLAPDQGLSKLFHPRAT